MKSIIKKISIIIASIIAIILVIYIISNVVLVYRSLYFPNQTKEFEVEIHESNIEAEFRIYVDNKVGDKLQVTLDGEDGKRLELEEKKGIEQIIYVKKAKAGAKYIVTVKNKTDSFVYSYVSVENNN